MIFKKIFPNGNFVCVDYIFLNDTIVYRFSVNNDEWQTIPGSYPTAYIEQLLKNTEALDKGLDERDKKLEDAYKFLTNLGFLESC